jgi:hypothetical protein
MAQTLTLAPAGLWTDPNPLSAAPQGALSVADNIVISRPGVVEARPGLPQLELTAAGASAENVIHIAPYDSDLIVFTLDSLGAGHVYAYSAAAEIVMGGPFAEADWSFTAGQVHTAILAGNLYFTSTQGVFRITSAADTTAYRAGIARPPQVIPDLETVGGINEPHTEDTAWAYRVCETATAGRLTIRSAPSARTVARSYTGDSPSWVENTFPRTPGNVTEIYRSPITAAFEDTPGDEMSMIGTAAASAAEFNDDASTTGIRGASLYTNATQGGALLENGITPICRDIATYREMMFFAGAARAPSMTFEVLAYGPDWRGSNQTYSDRLTYLIVTGGGVTVTSGSDTITGIGATEIAKLRVGMRVCDTAGTPDGNVADAQFSASTYITTIGATSITLDKVAIGNGTDFIAMDWIEVAVADAGGTQTSRVFISVGTTGSYTVQAGESLNSASSDMGGPQLIASTLSALFTAPLVTVSAFGDGVTGPWTFLVEAFAHDVTGITVKISNPGATPNRIDQTTGKSVERSGNVATLAWSKPGEPEHAPPPYSAVIGDADKAIIRIVPARDSLFVFKEDGTWRVSGYSPDTLQIDEVDRTLLISRFGRRDAACEWDGGVAIATTRGLVLVTDGGIREIGAPIHTEIAAQIPLYVAPWPDRQCILFGFPAPSANTYPIYVWWARTGAWTRWVHRRPISAATVLSGNLYLGLNLAGVPGETATYLLYNDNSGHDALTKSVTITAVNGLTISAAHGGFAQVGDIVTQSAVDYVIRTVPTTGTFTVASSGLVTGAATIASANIKCEVGLVAHDAENPGQQKLWREATLVFGEAPVASTNCALDYTTDRCTTEQSEYFAIAGASAPTTLRTRIPRNVRRGARLYPTLRIYPVAPGFEFHGMSIVANPVDTRFRNAS